MLAVDASSNTVYQLQKCTQNTSKAMTAHSSHLGDHTTRVNPTEMSNLEVTVWRVPSKRWRITRTNASLVIVCIIVGWDDVYIGDLRLQRNDRISTLDRRTLHTHLVGVEAPESPSPLRYPARAAQKFHQIR